MTELLTLHDYLTTHKNGIQLENTSLELSERSLNIFLVKTARLDIGYPTDLLFQANGKSYIKGNDAKLRIPFQHHAAILSHVFHQVSALPDSKSKMLIVSSNIRYFINDFFWFNIHHLIGSKSFIDLILNYNIFEYIQNSNSFVQLTGSKTISSPTKTSKINYETLKRFIPSSLISNSLYRKKNNTIQQLKDKLIITNSKTWLSLAKLDNEKAQIIQNSHRNIQYIHIFNSIIPRASNAQQKPTSTNSIINKNLVYRFTKVIIQKLVPCELFGDPRNKVILFQNIKKLIFADTNQYYDFKHLMANIKNVKQKDLFAEELFFWLYFNFFPSLVKQFFYVTKVNSQYELVYFRQSSALHFLEPAIKEYIDKFLTRDSIKCDGNRGYHDTSNGYYHCHFRIELKNLKVPNSFRFISAPNHKLSLGGNKEHYYFQQDNIIPINKILVHLRKEVFPKVFQDKQTVISNINDIIENFEHFKTKRKNYNRPLYFIKFDIKSSYDTLPKERIKRDLDLMFSKLKTASFYLTNEQSLTSSQLVHTTNTKLSKVKLNKNLAVNGMCVGNLVKKRKLNIDKKNDYHLSSSINVLQEMANIRKYSIDDVKYAINKELDSTIVNIGKHCYFRKEGIFQGLYFSSILANLFYDNLVRENQDVLLDEGEFFVRFMDDFLIITENYSRIDVIKDLLFQKFLMPKYNVDINMEKLNHSKLIDEETPETSKFSFVGLNFDLSDMSLTKDSQALSVIKYDHLTSYKEIFNKLIMVFSLRLSNEMILSLKINSIKVIETYILAVVNNISEMLLYFIIHNSHLKTHSKFFKKFINNLTNILTESINKQNQYKFFKEKQYYRFRKLCDDYESIVVDGFALVLKQNKSLKACTEFIKVLDNM